MTSDCYAILGVTPTAEDVVIGAAYRALMRQYHPDTNPDPKAQARAQEISAAYAVLRDPARRAEYDASRGAGGILWPFEEPTEPPPPMRTAGIATAVLAVVLVGAVWAWPRPSNSPRSEIAALTRDGGAKVRPDTPAVRPEPQARPPSVASAASPPVPAPPSAAPTDEVPKVEPVAAPPLPILAARAEPQRSVATVAARAATGRKPPEPAVPKADSKPAERKPSTDDQVATLDRLSAGFFSQSMVHATGAKKELLLAARDRSAAQRKACRSDFVRRRRLCPRDPRDRRDHGRPRRSQMSDCGPAAAAGASSNRY